MKPTYTRLPHLPLGARLTFCPTPAKNGLATAWVGRSCDGQYFILEPVAVKHHPVKGNAFAPVLAFKSYSDMVYYWLTITSAVRPVCPCADAVRICPHERLSRDVIDVLTGQVIARKGDPKVESTMALVRAICPDL